MRRHAFIALSPIGGSNFDRDYGFVDYSGKVVLDVGADYGSTAAYFLRKGAVRVVAVEGDDFFFSELEKNIGEVPEVTPVKCWVASSKDFEALIKTYCPDILKVDCEGCEKFLLTVSNRILRKVPEYLMETHNRELTEKFRAKFRTLGYTITHDEVVHVDFWGTSFNIIHAIPTQEFHNRRMRALQGRK